MSRNYRVAVVGATGAVGIEILDVMSRRNFPVAGLRLLASPRSAGKKLRFRGEDIPVQILGPDSFNDIDIAIFSAGSSTVKEYADIAVKAGAVVVDNSSAYRGVDTVPLIVPEINGDDVKKHQGIIANPNCTTAITLMGLYPLHQKFGVKRVFASSYQAVSGAGARAIDELQSQVHAIANQQPIEKDIFPHQIAFNVIPHVDVFLDSGYTKEEMKMQSEGQKIMHLPSFRASVTCVRVPIYRAHSVAISAEFEKTVDIAEARAAIAAFPGVQVLDDPESKHYPMPLFAAEQDDCFVGRIRKDCALENGLAFWVAGDQLLKGAALNAVQIAELL